MWHGACNITVPTLRRRDNVLLKNSRNLILYGRLQGGPFTIKNPILPQTSIEITLRRSKDEFSLIRDKDTAKVSDKYKIVIHQCNLYVNRIQLGVNASFKVQKMFEENKYLLAMYPFTQCYLTRVLIPALSSSWHSVISTSLGGTPERLYVGIMDEHSINGSNWENNPTIFPAAQYKVSSVQLYVNHVPVRITPRETDFTNGDFLDSWMDTMQTIPVFKHGFTCGVTTDDYKNVYCLFGFEVKEMQSKSIEVEIAFSEPIPKPLLLVVLSYKDIKFALDSDGYFKHWQH